MTLESEFTLRFAVEGFKVYTCNQCLSLVGWPDRADHRKKAHQGTEVRVTLDADDFISRLDQVRAQLMEMGVGISKPQEPVADAEPAKHIHDFNPGGRAHWDFPRCSVKWCRQFKIHPNHTEFYKELAGGDSAPGPDSSADGQAQERTDGG